MNQTFYFDSVASYNNFNQHKTLHPLVSVLDFSKAAPRTGSRMTFGIYCIFLKQVFCGDLKYGCSKYDYQEGTLVFVAPGQVIDVENKTDYYQPIGYGLAFHPDLIKGTQLASLLDEYSFFHYKHKEALHLSVEEKQIVLDCFERISTELAQNQDRHSKSLITSNIALFLNYCERFYDRQFTTRKQVNKGMLEKFEQLLNEYFKSDYPLSLGLPSVSFFAKELHLSPNYFGDLIKKETGKSAQEYVLLKTIDIAKEKLFDETKSISEIAYELGFKYPQHFSRLFKQRIGITPNEFRNSVVCD